MRTLTDHQLNPGTDQQGLVIEVVDERGSDGANLLYRAGPRYRDRGVYSQTVEFQHGPIKEAGVNGVTEEALLAIVIDRLKSFQAGPYACRENGRALVLLEDALRVLHNRTLARMQRGVEGTHTV